MTRTQCARPGCNRAGAGTTDMLCHPHRRAAGLHRHDGNEAREHVRRCLDNGWTLTRIGDQAGLSDATIFRLMRSTGGIATSTHRAIMAVDPDATRAAFRDPLGARRRAQALMAAGWRRQDLAALFGVGVDAVRELVNGAKPTIREATDQAVRRVYAAVEWAPARRPSPLIAKRGWPLPAEWDGLDIDNPDHHPHQLDKPTVSHAVDPVLVDRIHDDINTYGGIETGTRHKIPAADKPAIAAALYQRGHNPNIIARALTASHRSINTWTEAA